MQASRLGPRLLKTIKYSNVRPTTTRHSKPTATLPLYKGGQHCNTTYYFSSYSVHSLLHLPHTNAVNNEAKNTNGFPSQKQRFSTSNTSNSLSMSAGDVKKAVDSLTEQFMETRELLDDARHSLGTVYFSDDMSEAKTALTETLKMYEDLLKQLSPEQKEDVIRTIGLKMEELKAQGQALEDESVT